MRRIINQSRLRKIASPTDLRYSGLEPPSDDRAILLATADHEVLTFVDTNHQSIQGLSNKSRLRTSTFDRSPSDLARRKEASALSHEWPLRSLRLVHFKLTTGLPTTARNRSGEKRKRDAPLQRNTRERASRMQNRAGNANSAVVFGFLRRRRRSGGGRSRNEEEQKKQGKARE